MSKQNTILIIDAGGRGSTLVDAYARSDKVQRILVIPGNDLMQINTIKQVVTFPHLKTTSVNEIIEICEQENVTLVDVAQDNAVEAGLVDALLKKDIPTVGPTRAAGQLEWDKAWSREFMKRHHIPQPAYTVCTTQKEGIEFLNMQPESTWFVKASGLAEGKGALPAKNNAEAVDRINELQKFGKNAETFLVEEWLIGEEFSTYALCDGTSYTIIGSAQDHKRAYNFDEGENTGGMGCSSPPLVITEDIEKQIKEIITKTIRCMHEEERPYKGVLYIGGIIVNKNGTPTVLVIEYNARWGDPEVQCILPGLKTDLFEIGMAIAKGNIQNLQIETDNKSRVVVAGTSRGYPGDYSEVRGKQIYGLEEVQKLSGIKIYGAGIKLSGEKYVASGGRIFYIVGEGSSVIEARQKAYEAMSLISIEGNNLQYRTDIGWRDVERIRMKKH
jgi:phosphoribosylamine--glycine ligase